MAPSHISVWNDTASLKRLLSVPQIFCTRTTATGRGGAVWTAILIEVAGFDTRGGVGSKAGAAAVGTMTAVDRYQQVAVAVPLEGGVETEYMPSSIGVGEVGSVSDLDELVVCVIGQNETRREVAFRNIGQIDVHVGVIITAVAVNRVERHSRDGSLEACQLGTVDEGLDIAVVVEAVAHGTIAAGGS